MTRSSIVTRSAGRPARSGSRYGCVLVAQSVSGIIIPDLEGILYGALCILLILCHPFHGFGEDGGAFSRGAYARRQVYIIPRHGITDKVALRAHFILILDSSRDDGRAGMTRSSIVTGARASRPLWIMTWCVRIPQRLGIVIPRKGSMCAAVVSSFQDSERCGCSMYLAALTHGARYISSLRDYGKVALRAFY